MSTADPFDAAVRRHDERLAAAGLSIWVGSEPTFTDRMAQTPEWLSAALGGDKEARGQALLRRLARQWPGGVVLRSVGRRYPGEGAPRWNVGLYRRRDGAPLPALPPDPLLAVPHPLPAATPDALPGTPRDPVSARPSDVVPALPLDPLLAVSPHPAPAVPRDRLPTVPRGSEPAVPPDAVLAVPPRPASEAPPEPVPAALPEPMPADAGAGDAAAWVGALAAAFAAEGWQVDLTAAEAGGHRLAVTFAAGEAPCVFALRAGVPAQPPRLELPPLDGVPRWLAVLRCVADAAARCRLTALVVAGEPPPVDDTVELTTITPDPAVIEVNSAPSASAAEFLARSRQIYAAAAGLGLAPYRLYYNGAVADSGGGGQITLGGPSPEASPFIRAPRLLPRLVRFFNRHPSLSYLYAHDFVGSSGQSVRADERGSGAFDELALALELLDRHPDSGPALLWQSLAPFLSDAAGNNHRAEINIEKLHNPFLPGRGRQGLVEFRALRMQHTPERAAALACLLRAVVAMLAKTDGPLPLIDWGRELHERFALPFYLERDLAEVLAALSGAGFGLGEEIESVLRRDEFRHWADLRLPGAVLQLRRALEFWPLLGDAASPEQGGPCRLVDASTARVELRLRPVADPAFPGDWHDWQVACAGTALPLRRERDADGELRVYGIRYRSFAPAWGLHPALPAQAPVTLRLRHPALAEERVVTLHEWRPDGEAYPGLPADLDDAARRRAQRVTVCSAPPMPEAFGAGGDGRAPRAGSGGDRWALGLGPYCADLRYAGGPLGETAPSG
jgi:uncharacterized protein (DUF2126 family)